mgnify:CR=1 FL=1
MVRMIAPWKEVRDHARAARRSEYPLRRLARALRRVACPPGLGHPVPMATLTRLADALSRRWLARARNPYLPEIDAVAVRLGRAGAHLLNLSFEWTCTTGVEAP